MERAGRPRVYRPGTYRDLSIDNGCYMGTTSGKSRQAYRIACIDSPTREQTRECLSTGSSDNAANHHHQATAQSNGASSGASRRHHSQGSIWPERHCSPWYQQHVHGYVKPSGHKGDKIVGEDPIRTRTARRRGGGDDDSDRPVESEERGGFMFVTSLVSFP